MDHNFYFKTASSDSVNDENFSVLFLWLWTYSNHVFQEWLSCSSYAHKFFTEVLYIQTNCKWFHNPLMQPIGLLLSSTVCNAMHVRQRGLLTAQSAAPYRLLAVRLISDDRRIGSSGSQLKQSHKWIFWGYWSFFFSLSAPAWRGRQRVIGQNSGGLVGWAVASAYMLFPPPTKAHTHTHTHTHTYINMTRETLAGKSF